ncbi:MAG: Bug family tripartite tricarboxylate transporter substrate binding protein [Lautropia sp.]
MTILSMLAKTTCAMSVAALGLSSVTASAEGFPSKPITIVAPYVPGGTVDALARTLAVHLREEFGQQVVVENRAGASGGIGAAYVAAAPADGHTLLLTNSSLIVNPMVLKEKPPFNLQKDFTPIGQVAIAPLVFVVGSSSGIGSVQEFIALAKGRPEKVTFGVGGFGSGGHLAMESFNVETGTRIPMVLYRGGANALVDIAGGQVTAMMEPALTTVPYVTSGRMRAIAVTGDRRSELLPQVPTLAEAGVKNVDFVSWYGLWAPAQLPASVTQRVQAALAKVLGRADMREWLVKQGLIASTAMGPAFAKLIDDERIRYAEVVEKARIEPK